MHCVLVVMTKHTLLTCMLDRKFSSVMKKKLLQVQSFSKVNLLVCVCVCAFVCVVCELLTDIMIDSHFTLEQRSKDHSGQSQYLLK